MSRVLRVSSVVLALGRLVSPPGDAAACDLCAIYSATELHQSRPGFQIGVGQQFTRFDDLKDDGKSVPNPGNEYLNSSITQVLFGYNSDSRWGLQLNVPIISRTFRRNVEGGRERDDETGFGDLSLLGLLRPYARVTSSSVLTTTLFGGLKLPSGSTDRLREESAEHGHGDGEGDGDVHDEDDDGDDHHDEAHAGFVRQRERSGDETSGIHGHDLALGTGSVDGVIGGRLFFSWERFFLTTTVQYVMRTRGSFDYRYANDVQWRGGPGAFLLLDDDYALTAQFSVSGERKGKDELDGGAVDDTAITLVGIGPAFSFTWGTSLAADVGADIPVVRDNTGLQIVPVYRIRGGVSWRF